MTDKDPNYWAQRMDAIQTHRDKAAFKEIFEYFAPRVKSYLLKSGADTSIAEECAQETMVKVWQKADLFDCSRAALSTWIFTIARNKRIDVMRKENRSQPEENLWMPEPQTDLEEILTLQKESEQLNLALSELPLKQRDIITRAFFRGLTHRELAQETGLPLGTIKSRIRLALERLRHLMR